MCPTTVAPEEDPEPSGPSRHFQNQGRGPVGESGFYVLRAADDELFTLLDRGELCHVLAPRQIGKSSLRLSTQERLRARGIRCASVDLTGIGGEASPDEWYFSVASAIAQGLEIEGPEILWKKNRRMSPVRRFHQFLQDDVVGSPGPPVVIFLDEIDVTLSLPFPRDDFFNVIRATHQARAEDPRWKRLTCCLLGVAAPLDLIENAARTPFNSSVAVRVDDFTWEEARTFLPGLAGAEGDAEALLARVFEWTNGHPALTQRLCWRLVEQGAEAHAVPDVERVDALVEDLYLKSGRIEDPILLDAEARFSGDRPDARIPVMLHLYQRLLTGDEIPADGNNTRQFGLRIAGLAAERTDARGSWLRVRNLIFETVFGRGWIEARLARRFLTEPLQIWKDAGSSDDHVLRGEALKVALGWAQGRDDVTPDERDFLQASQSLAAEEKEKDRQAEMYRARARSEGRNARRFAVIAALALALAGVTAWASRVAQKRSEEAVALAKRAQEALELNKKQAAAAQIAAAGALQAANAIREKATQDAETAKKAADAATHDAEQSGLSAKQKQQAAERAEKLSAFAVALKQRADLARNDAENAASSERIARRSAESANEVLRASQDSASSTIQSLQIALQAARAQADQAQKDLATARAQVTALSDELTTARADADRLRNGSNTTAALIHVSAERDAANAEVKRLTAETSVTSVGEAREASPQKAADP